MQMFEVGGCVRDELLGVPSKDIDFTVVMDKVEGDPFRAMVNQLKMQGFKVFLESPQFFTVRAQFPECGRMPEPWASKNGFVKERSRLTADFVLARKERGYADGRRPDSVEVGTLEDDLARRDFTMNAIAKDAEGNLIDPFNGVEDIQHRLIRAVGDPRERLREDALRAVRALRFHVTKGFTIEGQLMKVLQFDEDLADRVAFNVADERIMEELSKMFRFDTLKSLHVLQNFPLLTGAMFSGKLSLDATMKQKGRGK